MQEQQWLISYKCRTGETGAKVISWPCEPDKESAAIRIRDHLLGENFLLVDTPRGHREPTQFLLKSYGYEITDIQMVDGGE